MFGGLRTIHYSSSLLDWPHPVGHPGPFLAWSLVLDWFALPRLGPDLVLLVLLVLPRLGQGPGLGLVCPSKTWPGPLLGLPLVCPSKTWPGPWLGLPLVCPFKTWPYLALGGLTKFPYPHIRGPLRLPGEGPSGPLLNTLYGVLHMGDPSPGGNRVYNPPIREGAFTP